MFRCLYAMVLVTALALALVWQGSGMRAAGYDVERLRGQIADQKAQTAMFEAHLSKLKSPQRVTTLVAWLGLDLQEQVPAPEPQEMVIARNTSPYVPGARAASPVDAGTMSVAVAPGL